jgi:Uma2 family endonuclease
MTLSAPHERFKCLLGYFIIILVEELGWNIASFGSMTMKRRRQLRGLEPDQCYWIQNEPLVRCRDTIDLRRDPPPDLSVEIDWTQSALDRLGIYAALRVPEVWQYDGQSLRVHVLGADGQYGASPQSRALPFLPMTEVARFLSLRTTLGEMDLLRAFRAWVQQRIVAGWK